jgi:putative transposase
MGIFIGFMRLMGRSPKGQRLYDLQAVCRGKNLTTIGAITQNEVLAFDIIAKSMKGEDFKQFIREKIVPKLWPGAVLVMDNLSAHKVEGIEEMIKSAGAQVVYLSPYSPEFNPIEHLWWEVKAFVRKFAPKNQVAVEKLVTLALKLCSKKHLQNYFAHCCYCTS